MRGFRSAVAEIDPSKPVGNLQTVEQNLRDQVSGRRVYMLLLSVFGAIAAVLAAVGIYGVMAYAVTQRTREIGIRMALGATVGEVVGMMLKVGARLLTIGIGVGLAASFATVKLLKGLVTNVSTFDPWSFAAVTIVIFAAGMFASFWPARRAARVDPVSALREI